MPETFDQLYDYRLDLMENFARQAEELRVLFEPLSEADSRARHIASGDSFHQLAAHLRDTEIQAFLPRFKRIIQEDRPSFDPFESPHWTEATYQPHESFLAILAEFIRARAEALTHMRALPQESWAREGFNPPTGWRTAQWWVERIHRHTREHLAEARQALAPHAHLDPNDWQIADKG